MSETTEEPNETPTDTVVVVDVPERARFEISVDGVPVGFTEYVDAAVGEGPDHTERTFPHTEIDEAYGGRGLASILIRTALDSSRIRGVLVVPQCSAVRGFIAKHPDYLDLVPVDQRAELGL